MLITNYFKGPENPFLNHFLTPTDVFCTQTTNVLPEVRTGLFISFIFALMTGLR